MDVILYLFIASSWQLSKTINKFPCFQGMIQEWLMFDDKKNKNKENTKGNENLGIIWGAYE